MDFVKKAVLVSALLIVGFVLSRLVMVAEPEILGMEDLAWIGKRTEARIVIRGPERIAGVHVEIGQDDRWYSILEDTRPERLKELTVEIRPGDYGLRDGRATIRIRAQGGWFRTTTVERETEIDTAPPVLAVVDATQWVKEGGTGAVRLRVRGADEVYIDDGARRFPCRPDPVTEQWRGFFALPVGSAAPDALWAVARDLAGNETRAPLPSAYRRANYPKQRITLSDSFLTQKVLPMLGPDGADLEPVNAFRKINEQWREEDEAVFAALGAKPPTGLVWDGSIFERLRNGKAMAPFGDHRRYFYRGSQVSASLHLGYDLASVRHADVPAAANGTVVFAGPLKIYGNTVVVDHGLGLMTLYSHLSEFLVSNGDIVVCGTPLARTGSTGFAFGDHLHFGVLVHGIAVNPLEWWDASWLENNVAAIVGARDTTLGRK